jgi:hypothetical protein
MREITEITKEIDATKQAYLAAHETLPAPKLAGFVEKIKGLQKELSSTIADGAKPCSKCGAVPHGMKSSRQVVGGVLFEVYEVGCISCPDIRSRAISPKEAVKMWNEEVYFVKEKK